MAVQTRVGMPMAEFIRQFDQSPFELIDGERIPIMPPVYAHGLIWKRLYALLAAYEQAHPELVEVYSELPFVLVYDSDWVSGSRVPDIMVFRTERIAAYRAQTPDFGDKPIVLVPDVCVEIISQNDNYQEVDAKVDSYLADGVQLIWVVNPRNQTVTIYTPDSNQFTRLKVDETLNGGTVLPNFSLPVKAIFPE